MKLVDRYILRELAAPFVAGAAAFVGVILLNTIVKSSDAIFRLNPPWHVTFQWLLYRVPVILTFALPVGMMLSCSLVVVHLGRGSELNPLRLGGLSLRRVFLPFFVCGLAVSLLALLNDELLAPRAATRANELLLRRILQAPGQAIKDSATFRAADQSFCHVSKVDLRRRVLHHVIIYHLTDGWPTEALAAQRCVREGDQWVLEDVHHQWFDRNGVLARTVAEPRHPVEFAADITELWDEEKNPEQMTFAETWRRRGLAAQAGDLANATRLTYFLHTKLSIPLTCFVFVLLAAPASLPFAQPRSSPYAGVLVTIVVIFFCNGTINWAKAIALSGPQSWMPPALAAWLHFFVFGLLGWELLRRME